MTQGQQVAMRRLLMEWAAMRELKPESEELLTFCRENIAEHEAIATSCLVPLFSKELRNDLYAILGSHDAVRLIEATTRMGGFCDTEEISYMRRAVSKQLLSKGIKLPRGKRTAPGLLEFVGEITPLLLHFGLPLRTNERSKLVLALRMIALEIGIKGDPRDELRRLKEKNAARKRDRGILIAIRQAVAKGLQSLRIITPP